MTLVAYRGPTLSGLNADPIDHLMLCTGGDILRVGDIGTGEYDELRLMSTRTRKRLAGARLVSTGHGLRADVLHHAATGLGLVPRIADMNADEFVAWYVGEAMRGLDWRAAQRRGGAVVAWEDQVEPEPEPEPEPVDSSGTDPVAVPGAPAWWAAWVLRTVHKPKADYIIALGRWAWDAGELPELPSAPWAISVLQKFANRGVEVS